MKIVSSTKTSAVYTRLPPYMQQCESLNVYVEFSGNCNLQSINELIKQYDNLPKYKKKIIVNVIKKHIDYVGYNHKYIEFVNDFLTVEGYADYYHLSDVIANEVISLGRFINQKMIHAN